MHCKKFESKANDRAQLLVFGLLVNRSNLTTANRPNPFKNPIGIIIDKLAVKHVKSSKIDLVKRSMVC